LIAYGLPAERLARVPHGILEPEMAAIPASTIPETGRDHTVTILLFGKLKPYKGIDILIRALGALSPSTRAECRLRIVGKPYMDLEPLTALARELGVENYIVWDLRFVADEALATLFSEADILAMPYRDIDASGVLTMALAAGRPIVASRIGLFSEILRDDIHGYLIPPEDPAALAAALGKLIDDREKRLAMGEQVRLLRTTIPTWQQIARMTEALYLETQNIAARAG
jgi:glycosyltransferase involved in cell wall biosynthesis